MLKANERETKYRKGSKSIIYKNVSTRGWSV
jgi:hypothetical protein